jgi:L-asparaginase/Glu-tRNA(Gln) amidotransferase subunit D
VVTHGTSTLEETAFFLFPLSVTKGSALSLKAIGSVLADNLGPQKARILLMLALAQRATQRSSRSTSIDRRNNRIGDRGPGR